MAGEVKTLVINAGSSSFKCWFQDVPEELPRHSLKPAWKAEAGAGADLAALLRGLWEGGSKAIASPSDIDVVGHRIVHGGAKFRESVFISPEVRAGIAEQAQFAPAHNRIQLAAIETIDRVAGHRVPQVAVFDTAFHSTMQPEAYVYPGPYHWLEQGIRRYGFHGISVQYALGRAADLLNLPASRLRIIVCHLGNGASITAVANGQSLDNSMGFTPLEGIMMGTRSGSVDPGILVHLLRQFGYSAAQLDELLNRQSGLLGVSGVSGDMRKVLEAIGEGNERARLAYGIYAHRLAREIGAMLAVLGGADAIVFTGGIGENCAPLRQDVCAQFAYAGLKLDSAKNEKPELDQAISAAGSAIQVLVIRADEDWQIACECHRLMQDLRGDQPLISPAATSST